MRKDIDVERLRKEVKGWKRAAHKSALDCADSETKKFFEGKEFAYGFVIVLIASLQQEQPSEDLESEIEKYFQGLWPGMKTAEQCNTDMHFTPPAIMRLASHFYELGLKAKKEE